MGDILQTRIPYQADAGDRNHPPLLIFILITGVFFGLRIYAAGMFNIESRQPTLALAARNQSFQPALPRLLRMFPVAIMLMSSIAVSLLLSTEYSGSDAFRIKTLPALLLFLAIVYSILLPPGGYRGYRPYIIRRDSIQPLIIGGLVLFAMASVHVLTRSSLAFGALYLLAFSAVAIHLTREDT